VAWRVVVASNRSRQGRAPLIRQRFTKADERRGLEGRMSRFDTCDPSQFRRPLVVPKTIVKPTSAAAAQMDLF
jgi:hypothetical protein